MNRNDLPQPATLKTTRILPRLVATEVVGDALRALRGGGAPLESTVSTTVATGSEGLEDK